MNRNNKKIFLEMIMFFKQQFTKLIKWGKLNKLTLNIKELIIFAITLLILNILMQGC